MPASEKTKPYLFTLFIFVAVTSTYFFQGANPNTNSRFNLARAIAEQGTLQIDTYAANTVDKSFFQGHYYSDKAPGMAFLEAGILKLINPLLPFFTNDRHVRANAQLCVLQFLLLSLLTAWTATLFFRLAQELLEVDSPSLAFALTLVCFGATFLFPYSTFLISHQLAADWLFITFYYVRRLENRRLSRASLLGLLLFISFGAMIEYPVSPWLALAYFFVVFRSWKQEGIYLLLPGTAMALLLGLYNHFAFGSAFRLGYGNLDGTPFASGMSQGFFGIQHFAIARVFHLLFSGYRGLFFYNPVFFFSLLGLGYGLRKKRYRGLAIMISLLFIYFVVLNASYNFWQGGACFGPRHLVPALPFLFLPIFFLPSTWLVSPVLWLVALLSWTFMMVGTAVTLMPFEPLSEPFWNYLLPLFLHGDLSITSHPVLQGELHLPNAEVAAWASFNFGELLLGLRGKASLIPLLLFQFVILAGILGIPAFNYVFKFCGLLRSRRAIRWSVSKLDYFLFSTLLISLLMGIYARSSGAF